jgi:hypothetical protein
MQPLDWRDRLPQHPTRRAPTRGNNPAFVTLHYNGPAIAQERTHAGWLAHFRFIAQFHQDNPAVRGDGIQYHYAILPDGTVVWLRDDNARLSHCGNATGNRDSLAIHFPLGGAQRPTSAAWAAWGALYDHLTARYHIPRANVYGHRQWPRVAGKPALSTRAQLGQGECPGDAIMALLAEWRVATHVARYRVRYPAPVREAPNTLAPVAWSGRAMLQPGFELIGATPVDGAAHKGDKRWLHWPGGGFVHWSAIETY